MINQMCLSLLRSHQNQTIKQKTQKRDNLVFQKNGLKMQTYINPN